MRLVHCKSVMVSHKMITAPNVLLVLCQKTLAFVQLFSQRLSKIVRSCELNPRWVLFMKKKKEFVKNNCIYVDRKNTPTIFR